MKDEIIICKKCGLMITDENIESQYICMCK